jgi:hypothetical protein
MRDATMSMSAYDKPMSSSSRAESADNDLRVTRASFHAATVANAFEKTDVKPAVVSTAAGREDAKAAIAMFL